MISFAIVITTVPTLVALTMSTPADPPKAAAGVVSTLSLKLPLFWPWFAQVEVQISTCGIAVEKTKYEYIVSALSPDTTTEVRQLILTPPVDTPYTTLKRELIWRTAGSNQQKLQELFNEVELGDRKSSNLLHMHQLWTGKEADNAVLCELFLQRLPQQCMLVLGPSGSSVSIDNLAEMADRIIKVSATSVATVYPAPIPPASADIESLHSQVRQLQDQLTSMHSRDSHRHSPTPACRHSHYRFRFLIYWC